jgi:hypothetical protein
MKLCGIMLDIWKKEELKILKKKIRCDFVPTLKCRPRVTQMNIEARNTNSTFLLPRLTCELYLHCLEQSFQILFLSMLQVSTTHRKTVMGAVMNTLETISPLEA